MRVLPGSRRIDSVELWEENGVPHRRLTVRMAGNPHLVSNAGDRPHETPVLGSERYRGQG